MNRSEELAWAAGLFEGEGCFSVLKRGTNPQAALSMVDEDIVKKFAIIMGEHIGKIYSYQKPPYQRVYKWQTTGFTGVQQSICLLWNGLGKRRKEKAKYVMITACKIRANQHKITCKNGHPYNHLDSKGYRRCIICRNEVHRAWRKRTGRS